MLTAILRIAMSPNDDNNANAQRRMSSLLYLPNQQGATADWNKSVADVTDFLKQVPQNLKTETDIKDWGTQTLTFFTSQRQRDLLSNFIGRSRSLAGVVAGQPDTCVGVFVVSLTQDVPAAVQQVPWEAVYLGSGFLQDRGIAVIREVFGAIAPDNFQKRNCQATSCLFRSDRLRKYPRIIARAEREALRQMANAFEMKFHEEAGLLPSQTLGNGTPPIITRPGGGSILHLAFHGRHDSSGKAINRIIHRERSWPLLRPKEREISPSNLARYMGKNNKYDFIFLNCCYSGTPGIVKRLEKESFPSALLQSECCWMIAANGGPIRNEIASKFATYMYERLETHSSSIVSAFWLARQMIRHDVGDHSAEWAITRLYARGCFDIAFVDLPDNGEERMKRKVRGTLNSARVMRNLLVEARLQSQLPTSIRQKIDEVHLVKEDELFSMDHIDQSLKLAEQSRKASVDGLKWLGRRAQQQSGYMLVLGLVVGAVLASLAMKLAFPAVGN